MRTKFLRQDIPAKRTFLWGILFALGALLLTAAPTLNAGAQTVAPVPALPDAPDSEAQSDSVASETTSSKTGAPPTNGVILSLNGPVTPPMAEYLVDGIEAANAENADLIIIEIDTPGGLVDSMKTIIKGVLASETPVATYVSPQGARSASAGLYIMYAAHISAMAPSTNTGAATPVEVGGGSQPTRESPFEDELREQKDDNGADEQDPDEDASPSDEAADAPSDDQAIRDNADDTPRDTAPVSSPDALRAKIINDSVAYIRSLAEERGRNADWAERAVREGVSVTHNEALELGVIDLIADDLDDLLQQIDGRTVKTNAGPVTLRTANMIVTKKEPTAVQKILGLIANPNVAVILMSLATTGIIIEMWNPGSIFPGFFGLVCLVLGLYSFQVLPFNWLPLILMGIGVMLMVVEAYTPTFGLAGLTGLILFAVGMYFLFPDNFRVSISVIATIVALCGGLLALLLFALVGSRSHGPMIGGEAIRRREGIVDDWDGTEGWVIVEGERWRARADKPLSKGAKIRVVDVDGLVLVVKQAKAGGLLGGLAPAEA